MFFSRNYVFKTILVQDANRAHLSTFVDIFHRHESILVSTVLLKCIPISPSFGFSCSTQLPNSPRKCSPNTKVVILRQAPQHFWCIDKISHTQPAKLPQTFTALLLTH